MVLMIRPREMAGLITMREGIEAVEEGFREWGRWPGINAPRRRVHVPSGVRVSVHQGGVPGAGFTGLMTHCERVVIQQDGTQEYSLRGRPVFVLYSAESGELMAVLAGEPQPKELSLNGVTAFRTAATSAVGTKCLARPDSRRLGILGSGAQARHHLLALSELYALESVAVYSRSAQNREAFAREMSVRGMAVRAVATAREAVEGSDIVLAVTNSNVPVLDGSWLSAGAHVTSIVGSNVGLQQGGFIRNKRSELDDETIRRADCIVVASREQVFQDQQADLYDRIERGLITPERLIELPEVLSGKAKGRTSPGQITLFKNNGGQGISDVALAGCLYRRARELGAGVELDVDGVEYKSPQAGGDQKTDPAAKV